MRRRWTAIGFAVAIWGVLLSATPAQAAPITGGIRFGGAVAPTDFLTTNSIDIVNDMAVVLCNPLQPCSGVFSAINGGTATYRDFSFNPLGGNITPLWSFAGFSFNLTNVTSIVRSANGIVLQGFGTLLGAGYDPTLALWSFSADETNMTFGFSSTTSATPTTVPDSGSTLILLGGGILALAFARRRLSLS